MHRSTHARPVPGRMRACLPHHARASLTNAHHLHPPQRCAPGAAGTVRGRDGRTQRAWRTRAPSHSASAVTPRRGPLARAAPRLLLPPVAQGIEQAAAPRALYMARPPLARRARGRAWRRCAWPYPPPHPAPRTTRTWRVSGVQGAPARPCGLALMGHEAAGRGRRTILDAMKPA